METASLLFACCSYEGLHVWPVAPLDTLLEVFLNLCSKEEDEDGRGDGSHNNSLKLGQMTSYSPWFMTL